MYNLLIVDDEHEIRNGLHNYFPWHEIGFQVVSVAENGMQALDYIDNHTVDVILCDIMMPVMSGLELAQKLHGKKSKIKIIFLSGYRDFEYAQKALAYGVKNYIVKPTKYNELVDIFSQLKGELDTENLKNPVSGHIDTKHYEDSSNSFHDKIITAINTYVTEQYKDATLENAAELVHMNPYYLSKFYKQKTGQNFSEYVTSVKMRKAAELLKSINYKTYEISYMVGYSTPKNFTRAFKNYFGKSPREYRGSVQSQN